jgi:hypothetical protein
MLLVRKQMGPYAWMVVAFSFALISCPESKECSDIQEGSSPSSTSAGFTVDASCGGVEVSAACMNSDTDCACTCENGTLAGVVFPDARICLTRQLGDNLEKVVQACNDGDLSRFVCEDEQPCNECYCPTGRPACFDGVCQACRFGLIADNGNVCLADGSSEPGCGDACVLAGGRCQQADGETFNDCEPEQCAGFAELHPAAPTAVLFDVETSPSSVACDEGEPLHIRLSLRGRRDGEAVFVTLTDGASFIDLQTNVVVNGTNGGADLDICTSTPITAGLARFAGGVESNARCARSFDQFRP